MKKLSRHAGFFIVILYLVSCGRDLEEAKRYSEMRSDCDSLINQADLIIQYNRRKADSLISIKSAGPANKADKNKILRKEQEIVTISEIASDMELVKKHLEAIKIFAKTGEKVNKRIIFFKRKYINYSTAIQIHDENVMIREITDGLSTGKFISKNSPKDLE